MIHSKSITRPSSSNIWMLLQLRLKQKCALILRGSMSLIIFCRLFTDFALLLQSRIIFQRTRVPLTYSA